MDRSANSESVLSTEGARAKQQSTNEEFKNLKQNLIAYNNATKSETSTLNDYVKSNSGRLTSEIQIILSKYISKPESTNKSNLFSDDKILITEEKEEQTGEISWMSVNEMSKFYIFNIK